MYRPSSSGSDEQSSHVSRSHAHRRRIIGSLLGLALVVAATFVVANEHDSLRSAIANVANHPPGRLAVLIIIMLASVVGNIALTAMMFHLLMARFGKVALGEMHAVIASATLLNYLPLRPGLIGRVAYHKTVNRIAIGDSVKAVLLAVMLSGTAALLMAAALFASRTTGFIPLWALATSAVVVPAIVGLLGRSHTSTRTVAWAFCVRLIDVLMTAARYHAAFALIGSPIDHAAAIACACISVLATMVPLVSNGLGLREWAIGLLAPVVASSQMELGLTADLLNRAAEVTVVVVAGLPATLWLARQARAASSADQ